MTRWALGRMAISLLAAVLYSDAVCVAADSPGAGVEIVRVNVGFNGRH